MDPNETQYVSNYIYKFQFANNMSSYFCPDGIHLLTMKGKKGDTDEVSCLHSYVYKWKNFKILYYTDEQASVVEKDPTQKYTFEVDDEIWYNKSKLELIQTVQNICLITPTKKNLFLEHLTQYFDDPKNIIEKRTIADVIGFVPENPLLPLGGWQLPDKFYFVSGNDFRQAIADNIKKLCSYEIDPKIDVIKLMKDFYDITTIDFKDYIFAYGMIAPFLYSLRSTSKLMPLLALGGPGGKGKTAIEEFFTVKVWTNIPEIIGSATMETTPRIQGVLTGSTLPVCIDDCEDLKEFVTGIFKRYTTSGERVKKLNPDQTTKMDCEYCSPVMMNFNALPVMFDDPPFRQRIIILNIDKVKENEKWLKVYKEIPNMLFGKYILEKTRNMSFIELRDLFYKQDCMENVVSGNRQKTIVRIMNLGKHFAKQWFDLDLNLSQLPQIIQETLIAGNESTIDLIKSQIEESKTFYENERGIFVNPNVKSWVHVQVREYKYQEELGYLYTVENALDLADRSGVKKRNMSLSRLMLLLKTEWGRIKYGVFADKESISGATRAIFIPLSALDNTDKDVENAEAMEREINQDFEQIGIEEIPLVVQNHE